MEVVSARQDPHGVVLLETFQAKATILGIPPVPCLDRQSLERTCSAALLVPADAEALLWLQLKGSLAASKLRVEHHLRGAPSLLLLSLGAAVADHVDRHKAEENAQKGHCRHHRDEGNGREGVRTDAMTGRPAAVLEADPRAIRGGAQNEQCFVTARQHHLRRQRVVRRKTPHQRPTVRSHGRVDGEAVRTDEVCEPGCELYRLQPCPRPNQPSAPSLGDRGVVLSAAALSNNLALKVSEPLHMT
mmetsp:Transcript_103018/g.230076  ORF Transcript_103018/g.230076 Transcript_103018/m.230076 type:complete len:245 (-) Transcript_103018:110-844(-)